MGEKDRADWHVLHIEDDCHWAVISPLGIIFRRYPDKYKAHIRAADMNAHMLGTSCDPPQESDYWEQQDPETRRACEKFLSDLENLGAEDDDNEFTL
jgi:hypothetical protein